MSLFIGVILFTSLSYIKATNATVPIEYDKQKVKDPVSAKDKFGMPFYYDFIETMKKQGYVFWDFEKFYTADKSKLPEKLIVIRHDIHGRDIEGGIKADQIEKHLIGKRTATYFVQYDDPTEMTDFGLQQDYLNFINLLKKDTVDVQPHISINDLYLNYDTPSWRDTDVTELKVLFDEYYEIKIVNDSTGIGTHVIPKSIDTMKLKLMNTKIIKILKIYNAKWEKATGLKPRYYASHGSHSPINLVLNNAVILDQTSLLHNGIYLFDTYNTWVAHYLTYLSDNSIPNWISNPSEIKPGRYQLLMHPWVWDNYINSASIKPGQQIDWLSHRKNTKKTRLVNKKLINKNKTETINFD